MKLHRMLLAALAVLWPGIANAQDLVYESQIDELDPLYHRAYLYQDQCFLSSVGTGVRYESYELVLDVAQGPVDLTADTCAGLGSRPYRLDTVLFVYQRPDGSPGAFDPALPCLNLVAYDDDFCGPSSLVASEALEPGNVDLVVTTFANAQKGPYRLKVSSTSAPLERFVFYSGFEQGSATSWPGVSQ